MPWYNVRGVGRTHFNFGAAGNRKAPPPCASCGDISGFQCDWKMPGKRTCDRHLCRTCAQEVAHDKHLCPEHQAAWANFRLEHSPASK